MRPPLPGTSVRTSVRSTASTTARAMVRITVAVLALAAIVWVQELGAAQRSAASEVVDVVEIEVPVHVSVNGEPLRGLTRDDFRLAVGGKKRRIVGFRVIDLKAPAAGSESGEPGRMAGGSSVSLDERRHFVLLFDLTFATPPKIVRARDAALRLVREGLAPTDLVSVATFSTARGVDVPLGFTPDRDQVQQAIANLGRREIAEGRRDPLGLVFSDADLGSRSPVSTELVRFGEAAPAGTLQNLEEAQNLALQLHAQQSLNEALTELATTLRPVPGRKHVLYLSEGASSTLLLGVGRGATATERRQIQAMNEASMKGEVWSVNSNQRFGYTGELVQFERMLKEFVRGGASIQAIDIGGVRSDHDGQNSGDDTLFMMANKTGGEYVRNHNDLMVAMDKILTRTAVSYVLSFEAEPRRRGGRYQEIKVRLNRKIRGARLEHRPGYFTPIPFAERSEQERRAEAAAWIFDDHERDGLELSVVSRTLASIDPESGRRTIAVAVEAGALPTTTSSGGLLELECYGYAIAADGRIAGFFDRRVAMELGDRDGDSRVRFEGRLELAPGIYDLRILVRENSAGATATRSQVLEVPSAR